MEHSTLVPLPSSDKNMSGAEVLIVVSAIAAFAELAEQVTNVAQAFAKGTNRSLSVKNS
jgi:hypothetical protein